MTSQLKVDKLQGRTTAGSIVVTSEGTSVETNLQQGLAKHWVRLNGTGTIAVIDGFNNSSLTDDGTGDHDANLTNAFSNTGYATQFSSGQFHSTDGDNQSTSQYNIETYNSSHSAADVARVSMCAWGDLA